MNDTAFRWLPREDAILRGNARASDIGISELLAAAGFARSVQAVKGRRRTLGQIDRNKTWGDPEREARVLALYDEGHSAAQIAVKLFAEFRMVLTRNAVIGKLNRLGAVRPGRAAVTQALGAVGRRVKEQRKPPAAPKPSRNFQHGGGCVVDMIPKDPKPVRMIGPLPGSRDLPMWHPAFGGCRYPTSDDDAAVITFCCIPTEEGATYCPSHAMACCGPASTKKSAKDMLRSLRRYVA